MGNKSMWPHRESLYPVSGFLTEALTYITIAAAGQKTFDLRIELHFPSHKRKTLANVFAFKVRAWETLTKSTHSSWCIFKMWSLNVWYEGWGNTVYLETYFKLRVQFFFLSTLGILKKDIVTKKRIFCWTKRDNKFLQTIQHHLVNMKVRSVSLEFCDWQQQWGLLI